MKACNDLNFLNNYWSEAKAIALRINKELPKIHKPNLGDGKSKMYIIKYSDLGNSWSVEDICKKLSGRSKTLEALSDKISHMIYDGNADSVKEMVEKICTGRVKSLKQPGLSKRNHLHNGETVIVKESEYLGKGHFRWNQKAYILDNSELKALKQYFKI